MAKKICRECKFWYATKIMPDQGECRRFPPQRQEAVDYEFNEFPTIKGNSWCGEYQPKAT